MNRWLFLPFCVAWFSLQSALPRADGQQYVVVVLDDSGSMDGTIRTDRGRVKKIEAAKQALRRVAQNLPPDTHVGVLALNTRLGDSNWVLPIGMHTSSDVSERIDGIRAQGGTPLGAALKKAADALLELRQQQVYGLYRLLVVTDGEANDPSLVEGYLADALSRGLVVDAIGVDMASDHSLATRVHSYRSVNDEQGLEQAISAVLAETPGDDAAAEGDFALLAGLPDEVVVAAVGALARVRNQPVEQVDMEYVVVDEEGHSTVQHVAPRSTRGVGLSSIVLAGALCCMGGFLGLVVAVAVLVTGVRRRR